MTDLARWDHVALLVSALEPALAALATFDPGLVAGPVQEFEDEGTREVYLDRGDARAPGRLLLIEPTGRGPYARALLRRGPGLHHVGLAVPDAPAFAAERAGWLLHPRSLETLAAARTLWLARPGVGLLVEVSERPPGPDDAPVTPVVTGVEVAATDSRAEALLAALCPELACSADGQAWLTLGERRLGAAALG
ncbi:MAG: hypothetical protein M9894_32270 [Planctomycetes bacterium]|nr:hypothetical protein [Planctomycetota bacterium]